MLAWCREWGSQRLEMLKGRAESDRSWGVVWKKGWVSQPSEAAGFLPNWQHLKRVPSIPTPTPVLPYHTPTEQEGDIPFIPKTLQAPLGCIFLANYLLFSWGFVDFVFSKHQNCKVSQLFDYNSAINSVCFILSLALLSAMIGAEAKAIRGFSEHRFFSFCHTMQHVELPWPGAKPRPPAAEAQSLIHWITREVPEHRFFIVMQLMLSYICARLMQFTGS